MRPQSQSALLEEAGRVAKSGKRVLIGERSGKYLYDSNTPDLVIQEFADNGTENGKRRNRSKELSALRNEISSYLFEYLDGFGIPTHFVSRLTETEMMVKRTELIPVTLSIYNIAARSLAQRFDLKEGELLEFPVFEYFHIAKDKSPNWINEYHLYSFDILTPDELKQINRIASKVNAVLRGLCDRRHLVLAYLQLEFGRSKEQIVLSDELSPITCHFIDVSTDDPKRRERFHANHEDAIETFTELRNRLTLKV